jgi:hypothetical protein
MDENGHFILDDVETWPSEVRALLRSAEITKDNRRTVAEGIHALVKDCTISGFHCTRLTEAEQAILLSSRRIYPLGPEHALARIQDRVLAGDFSQQIGNALKQNSAAARIGRKGYFHFLLEREVPDSFYHFFRYWGGESLYLPFIKEDGEMEQALHAVGIACVVEVSIPVQMLPHQTAANGILSMHAQWNKIQGIGEEGRYGCVESDLEVVRIIQHGSPDFRPFLEGVSWFRPIHSELT